MIGISVAASASLGAQMMPHTKDRMSPMDEKVKHRGILRRFMELSFLSVFFCIDVGLHPFFILLYIL